MPSSTSLRPGPHDPYNSSSVKLAEATRVRLVLPGLGTADKCEVPASPNKKANTGDLHSKSEAAAARAKARKKLLKIQGIASQAEKAHSSVIVEEGVLAADAAEDQQGDADVARGSAGITAAGACGNAARSSEAAAAAGGAWTEKRSSRHGANSYAVSTVAAGSATGTQPVRSNRSAAGGSDVSKCSNRLALPSPDSPAAGTGAAEEDSGVSSTRSSAPSSRRGEQNDKARVPIWERSQPQPPAEDRKACAAATQHRVFQPVAIKTFSPTLGSLGCNLSQETPWLPPDEPGAMPAKGAVNGRSRSAARTPGQLSNTATAAGVQQRHQHFDSSCHHLSSRKSSGAPESLLNSRSKSFTGGYQISSQLFGVRDCGWFCSSRRVPSSAVC